MKNFDNNIDRLISTILSEEIENKSKKLFEQAHGEWTEIVADESDEEMDEQEQEEGNAFTGALANAKGKGKKSFDVDGETYPVKEDEEMDEQEQEEGNAFTGALANAKNKGKKSFDVDGETYPVKESEEKWIQKTKSKKGALHKKLGIPEGDKIPKAFLSKLKKELMKKGEGDKKLTDSDSKLLKQVNLAMTLKNIKENKNILKLTENELIDMIETLVMEQEKENKTKDNISKKEATGLKKTEKVLGQSKKENDQYLKDVTKKLTEYLKDGSKGKYDTNPKHFPKGNGQLEKMEKMAYIPSEAVEEYVDAFAYPGQTSLVYDEIKPEDKKIEKYLKGDATTGNSQKYANAEETNVGDKFHKNYKENLYGAEQMNVSYKRQPQPVDIAGKNTSNGNLASKRGKNSVQKAQKIMNKLESVENKKEKIIKEEMDKMKTLIIYNRKTQ